MTPNGDVLYHVLLSEKVTVQDKTSQRDMKDGALTFREQLVGTTHIGESMAQKTSIGDVLIPRQTPEKYNGHQTAIGKFEFFKRDNNKHLCKAMDVTTF